MLRNSKNRRNAYVYTDVQLVAQHEQPEQCYRTWYRERLKSSIAHIKAAQTMSRQQQQGSLACSKPVFEDCCYLTPSWRYIVGCIGLCGTRSSLHVVSEHIAWGWAPPQELWLLDSGLAKEVSVLPWLTQSGSRDCCQCSRSGQSPTLTADVLCWLIGKITQRTTSGSSARKHWRNDDHHSIFESWQSSYDQCRLAKRAQRDLMFFKEKHQQQGSNGRSFRQGLHHIHIDIA